MNEQATEFIELMGRHMEEDGLPRIAGRLFGALMINAHPCSLDELTDQLQVSKASVSSNARLLVQTGLAERVTQPGDRRDYYQIADEMHVLVLERVVDRLQIMADRLRHGREALSGDSGKVAARFDRVIDFHERLIGLVCGGSNGVRSHRNGFPERTRRRGRPGV